MKLSHRRNSKVPKEKSKWWLLLSLGCGIGSVLSAAAILNVQVLVQRFPGSDFSSAIRRTTTSDTAIRDPNTIIQSGFPLTSSKSSANKATQGEVVSNTANVPNRKVQASLSSTSPLQGIKILVAIAAFDFNQIPHLEDVLDSYHDIAIAGAKVDVVIHSTVAYPVTYIDLLNSRFTTENYSITIVLKSSALRLHLVDCHRGKPFNTHRKDYMPLRILTHHCSPIHRALL